ncbi:MAG: helix-turn-helix domain-containing protein [Alphaproteobacteria bacterium]|nr:helix-turn-helix domain-containing protein [Alphaproteobacteria bacterium]MBV8408130.1 helix-turn-helix domain-containing protein [Alphaproteobacteria bacterium]
MIGCGTATFTDPDDYRAEVPGAQVDLVLTGTDRFRARVTRVTLRRLNVFRLEESTARVASVSLAPDILFLSFQLSRKAPAFWNGRALRRDELVLHGSGEHFHQRTLGASRWGMISLAAGDLAAHSRALLGAKLTMPPTMQIVRPAFDDMATLLRLHNQACRLAEARPDMTAHPEVARALEQGLARALVACLADSTSHGLASARRQHNDVLVRFEQVLVAHNRPVALPELCAELGIAERTLRSCCSQLVGMSPLRYARLRRLHLVRAALSKANAHGLTVGTVARTYGFSELGRFAAAYRAAFGEVPSATLRRSEHAAD